MASKAKLHQKQAPSMAKAWKIPPTSQIPGVTRSAEPSQTCHHHLQLLFSSLLHIPTIIVLLPSVIPGIPWQGRTSALSSALSECTHGFTSLSAVRVTGGWHVLFSTLPADTLQAFQFAHYQFTVGSSQHSLLIELGLTPPGAGWPITQLYPCSRNFYKRQSLQKLVSLSGSSNFECFLNQKHQTLSALCELEASSAEFLKPADKAMQDTLPGTEAIKLQTVQRWLVFSSLSEGLNMSKSSTS